jgi:hypothetical protein
MGFNIYKFAEDFKNTIDWMLNGEHAQTIKAELQHFRNNKDTLTGNPDSIEALGTIIELLKTNGWHFRTPARFHKDWESFVERHGKNFRTEEAKGELIRMVGERKREIEKLFTYRTLKQFTEKLYTLAQNGQTDVLGEKGRDNYLRDFGYWDRIPMDVHEKRFIIRSGIYHACTAKDKSDHLGGEDLHDALTRFCTKYLKNHVVEEIELGSAPGIVDIFIWSFSAEDRYNICGATPNCEKCNLKNVCLYALTNLELQTRISS